VGQLTALALVVRLLSPSGAVALEVSREGGGPLTYSVLMGRDVVVEPSRLGVVVDAKNLADDVNVDRTQSYAVDEEYPWYGAHETAVNRCRGARLALTHNATRTAWMLDARACDDGAAFRYIVPGDAGALRTPDEATTFRRFLAGAADYTPVVFGERRKDTSWADQIATAVAFTSPVLVFGGHPQSLLENPAVES
jgi:hypothetical protein